ncbi:solute carrier family 35, member F1 [Dunaliella salina]|uniref:Solute carrier family 35, member F1 n=1 Tax=Dunaliella salina TaxID=3046 RepID=A0ABQ7GKX1_DUNSA|nr:solute carrier family 35, member F1 [Dunaliella salina]|eukprot:KAF5835255.1 solute carrier family 35, member F1 [Dunaliella salina]
MHSLVPHEDDTRGSVHWSKGKMDIRRWISEKPLVQAILLAQGLSFLLCLMGITSGVLAERGINAPTTQSLLNYILLALVCGTIHASRHSWRWPKGRNAWYVYMLLALMDVEANFIVTKAYQYTSITSVTLLDCFTIPAVMVLSWLVLRARYGVGHLLGAVMCCIGLGVLVLTDRQSETGGPNTLLGDSLVLFGATVYAVCNVTQERLLADTSKWELLASVSMFSTIFSGLQALLLEHSSWAGHAMDWRAGLALAGFALSLFCFSILLPSVLVLGGSAVLNLSLLTSDLWAAGARAVFFGGFGGTAPYFAMAFVLEALGICLYTVAGETRSLQVMDGCSGGVAQSVCAPHNVPSCGRDVEQEHKGGEAEQEEVAGERESLLSAAPGARVSAEVAIQGRQS